MMEGGVQHASPRDCCLWSISTIILQNMTPSCVPPFAIETRVRNLGYSETALLASFADLVHLKVAPRNDFVYFVFPEFDWCFPMRSVLGGPCLCDIQPILCKICGSGVFATFTT